MELSISTIIKIILGVLVIAAVAYGLYVFFRNNVFDSFNNLGLDSSVDAFLALV
jgi:uncharacterized membrane protein (DUF485 family)